MTEKWKIVGEVGREDFNPSESDSFTVSKKDDAIQIAEDFGYPFILSRRQAKELVDILNKELSSSLGSKA